MPHVIIPGIEEWMYCFCYVIYSPRMQNVLAHVSYIFEDLEVSIEDPTTVTLSFLAKPRLEPPVRSPKKPN